MIDLNIGGIGGSNHPSLATNVPRAEEVVVITAPEADQLRSMMEPVTITRGHMLTIVQSIKQLTERIEVLEARLNDTLADPMSDAS